MLQIVKQMQAEFRSELDRVSKLSVKLCGWADQGLKNKEHMEKTVTEWVDAGLNMKADVDNILANIRRKADEIDAEIARLERVRPEET